MLLFWAKLKWMDVQCMAKRGKKTWLVCAACLENLIGPARPKICLENQVMVPTLNECISQTMDPNEMIPKGCERGHGKVQLLWRKYFQIMPWSARKLAKKSWQILKILDLEIFLSVLKKCLTLTKHNFLNSNPNGENFISLESLEQEEQLSCWRNFQMELLSWCKMGLKWVQRSWKLALNGKSTISKLSNFSNSWLNDESMIQPWSNFTCRIP